MFRRLLVVSLLAALLAAWSPRSEAQVSVTIQTCGVVTLYVPATAVTAGAITIGLVPYVIAPGVTIAGHEAIQVGVDMCLSATLNVAGQIVLPSSIFLNVTTEIAVCGTVTAYVAATATVAGSITIGGLTYPIAAGTVITNETLIVVGVKLCLQATVNAIGQIVAGIVTPDGGNHPPAIDAPSSATARVGQTLNFPVTATDPDAGDSVTLQATGLPAGASASPNPATGNPASLQFSFTPTASQAGQTVTATFSADDGHGGTASKVVQISVTEEGGGGGGGGNTAPTLSVPGPQTVAVEQTLAFVVAASDADDDAVTLSATGVPQNASFNPATGAFTFTPSAAQGGQSFTVTFTATDSHGASTSASVTISVTSEGGGGTGGPPVLSVPPGPLSVSVGSTLTFVVTATSPIPGCLVTVVASGLPQNATFNPTTGAFTFVPSEGQAGQSFAVTFRATDCQDQTSSATVTIVVTAGGGGGGGGGGTVGGSACVSVSRVVFTPVPIGGGCGFAVVTLFNSGRDPLAVREFTFDGGSQFAVGDLATPLMLLPGNATQIRIAFVPTRAGRHKDVLRITTSDRDRPAVVIRLAGRALQR